MAGTFKYETKQIVAALRETKGMVYLAAKRLGCNPDTIYHRAKQHKSIGDAIRRERGEVIDIAELKLFQAINDGDLAAIKYCLGTIGKDRGYVERQEHSGPDGKELPAIRYIHIRRSKPSTNGEVHSAARPTE